MPTPWDIGNQFTQMLYNDRKMRMQYDILAQNRIAAAEIARQNASTAFNRQLERDALTRQGLETRATTAYERQLKRDEATRAFRHRENELTRNAQYGDTSLLTDPSAAPTPDTTAPDTVDTSTTGSVTGGAVGATDANGRVTPQSAYAYLTSRGMPPMVAAGVVGNIDVESGWDQGVFSGHRMGDRGTAGYSGQWRGSRLANLHAFAQSRGHSLPTPEDQLDFYYEEARSGTDAGARRAFELAAQARTPEEAAHAIMTHYERPNPQYANAGRRMSAARAIYGSGGAGAGPAVAPVTTQRRYGMATSSPAPADTSYLGTTYDPTDMNDPSVDMMAQQEIQDAQDEAQFMGPDLTAQPWTADDYAANGVTPTDMMGVPPNMDVVDTGYYSDPAVQLMPDEMRSRLAPMQSATAEGANKYMIMQPKGTKGMIAAPNPQIQTIPTGNKTRRNAQGQLEINVDNQWRTTGG